MNIEEMKLIIDAIKSLSGDATTALIWWMVFDLVKLTLMSSVVVAIVWLISKGIGSMSEWADAGKQVARAYGGEGSSYFYKTDRVAMDKAVKKAGEQA